MLPPSGPEWTDVGRPGVSRAAATSQRRLSQRDGPHRHARRDRPPQTPKMAKVEVKRRRVPPSHRVAVHNYAPKGRST